MSLNHSPSTVTDGLVLYYDMSNTKKSFKGAPATNLRTYSQGFSNWTKSGGIDTIADNTDIAPDGTRTAAKITANGSTNSYITRTVESNTGVTYTNSIYAKAGSTSSLIFEIYDNNGAGGTAYFDTIFNLLTGVVTSSAAGNTAYIVSVGSGWYRCIVTRSITLTMANNGTYYIGTYGAGTGSLYLWGAQYEIGTFATPYIPTTTATVTRSNTQALLDLTGLNTLTATSLTYAADNTFSFVEASSNVLNLGNNANTQFPHNSPWSVQLVAKRSTSVNSFPGWLVKGSSTTTGVLLFWTPGNGQVVWKHNNVQPNMFASVMDQYFALSITYDGVSSMIFYVNGIQTLTGGAMASTDTTSDLLLGRGDQYGQSTIPQFSKYNRALTAQEVKQNFNAIRGRYGL